jgi:hypothetical protein
MKNYRVIYLPHGREDKEWLDVKAIDRPEIVKTFNAGIILDVREIMEEDND